MNPSISTKTLCSFSRGKQAVLKATFALAMICAGSAYAQSWEYRAYNSSQMARIGYVTLEEQDGKSKFRFFSGSLDTCFQGPLDANTTKTEATLTITLVPRLQGCGEVRFVLKNDGTSGQREVKSGTEWVWDQRDRGLNLKK